MKIHGCSNALHVQAYTHGLADGGENNIHVYADGGENNMCIYVRPHSSLRLWPGRSTHVQVRQRRHARAHGHRVEQTLARHVVVSMQAA